MSIRRAASWCQPLQVRSLPRGARMVGVSVVSVMGSPSVRIMIQSCTGSSKSPARGSSMGATEDSLALSYRTTGPVTLTGDDLSIEEVVRIARRGASVEVSREALGRVRRARDVVDRVLERGDLVYGANTGVGSLSRHRIPFECLEQFSVRLVSRHTTHQG